MNRKNVFGYRNVTTGVIWPGYSPVFSLLSNPEHPDNEGRLKLLGNDAVHGRLEWEAITDKATWDRLSQSEIVIQSSPSGTVTGSERSVKRGMAAVERVRKVRGRQPKAREPAPPLPEEKNSPADDDVHAG